MEVHHHPEVEKKGFKEYILEGLMIFLAVTMGFFAETIREGISDNAKGREYIRSFVQDLKADSVAMSRLAIFDKKKISVLNGQDACFDSISNNPQSASCLVPLVKIANYNRRLQFSDGTLQQLKNAGGFRLLKREDRDSIVAYDRAIQALKDYEATLFQQQQDNVRNTYNLLGNYKANVEIFPDSGKADVKAPILFASDKALLNRYFNDLFSYRNAARGQLNQVQRLKIKAAVLIKYFDDKYGLTAE
ncbi:MAG TPA: hypothetical protein VHS53_13520 [Mucilaginibacter sp.]|jgi:hypothetical protein|nr:hypothetical protein [Mucilaginibacter sp.]HWD89874.1 hypothetical protein [Mucilaginibacter sp.]